MYILLMVVVGFSFMTLWKNVLHKTSLMNEDERQSKQHLLKVYHMLYMCTM